MRPLVPILVDPKIGFNAVYHGPFDARIVVGEALYHSFTREEVKAILAHEVGHRELYHVERCWAAIITGYALGAVSALWCLAYVLGWLALPNGNLILAFGLAPLAGIYLAKLMRIWHEFEADTYAARTFGANLCRTAFDRLLTATNGHGSRMARARLWLMDFWSRRGA